jgi:hypothetical protein
MSQEQPEPTTDGAPPAAAPEQLLLRVRIELPTGQTHEVQLPRDMTISNFYKELCAAWSVNDWELVAVSSAKQFTIAYEGEENEIGQTMVSAIAARPDFDHFLLTYPLLCG